MERTDDNLADLLRIEVHNLLDDCETYHETFKEKMVGVYAQNAVSPDRATNTKGYSGDYHCLGCDDKLIEGRELDFYSQIDFNHAEGAKLTTVKSLSSVNGNSLIPVQIPGTDAYGLKIDTHNAGIQFALDDLGWDAGDIAAGTELAVSVEYYLPIGTLSSNRLTFGMDRNIALYAGYSGITWDAVCVNQNTPMSMGELNVATFTLGVNSTYHVDEGQWNVEQPITEATTFETVNAANKLINGESVTLLAWGDKMPVYIKSITIHDAAELNDVSVSDPGYYFTNLEGVAVDPIYYPQYTVNQSYGITAALEAAEYYPEDTACEYPRFNYMYVRMPAEMLANAQADPVVSTPVKVVFKAKDGADVQEVSYQYQVSLSNGSDRWSARQNATFENGEATFVLLDAVFGNGLNKNSSIRLLDVHYAQTKVEGQDPSYSIETGNDLADLVEIRVYDLRKAGVCSEYHTNGFTVDNGNLVYDGYRASTFDVPGETGNLKCAHCDEVLAQSQPLPLLTHYAQIDFNNATAAQNTGMLSVNVIDNKTSIVPVQIPDTDVYGLKIGAHNSGLKFKMNHIGITEDQILSGEKELAITVEYYAPSNLRNDMRLCFQATGLPNSQRLAVYSNYSGTTWDAVSVNQGKPLTRDTLNILSFTVGAHSTYEAVAGQFSADEKITEPQTVQTLEFAQKLVNGEEIFMRGWAVDVDIKDPEGEVIGTEERPIYIKSITIYDADKLTKQTVDTTMEYIDFTTEYTECEEYYPDYVQKGSANGMAGTTVLEDPDDADNTTYTYITTTYSLVGAEQEFRPVVVRFVFNEDIDFTSFGWSYQAAKNNAEGKLWAHMTSEIGEDNTVTAVLTDACFTNGLNNRGSLRMANSTAHPHFDSLDRIEVFVMADTAALAALIAQTDTLTQYKTPASVTAYKEAVAAAKAIMDDPWSTQEQVDEALADLTAAQALLVNCNHACGTKLVGYVPETCTKPGYSGDLACKDCGFVAPADKGQDIPAHDTDLINVKKTSCKEAGYTGDLYCNKCKKIAVYGEDIMKLPHTWNDGVVIQQATKDQPGLIEKTCTVCKETIKVEFDFVAQLGDVDHSGKVDSTDARLVLQFAVKKISPTAVDLQVADVSGDGKVDSTDARLILQYAVKKIKTFPALAQ